MPSFFKEKTYRSEKYLKFVRTLPCCVSKQTPCDAHHLKGKGTLLCGMGITFSDLRAIPLAHLLHDELHSQGVLSFQRKYDIDLDQARFDSLLRYIIKMTNDTDHWALLADILEKEVKRLEAEN